MQMGQNSDVPYRGVTVHIQTEDHGLSSKKITTQVFFSGAILESKTVSYADRVADLGDDERDDLIRKMMKAMHREFYRRIQAGNYDARLPLPSDLDLDVPSIDSLDLPPDILVSAPEAPADPVPSPAEGSGMRGTAAWAAVASSAPFMNSSSSAPAAAASLGSSAFAASGVGAGRTDRAQRRSAIGAFSRTSAFRGIGVQDAAIDAELGALIERLARS